MNSNAPADLTPKQKLNKILAAADASKRTINGLIEKHFKRLRRLTVDQRKGPDGKALKANIKALRAESDELDFLRLRAINAAIGASGIIAALEGETKKARDAANEIKILTSKIEKFTDAVNMVSEIVGKITSLV